MLDALILALDALSRTFLGWGRARGQGAGVGGRCIWFVIVCAAFNYMVVISSVFTVRFGVVRIFDVYLYDERVDILPSRLYSVSRKKYLIIGSRQFRRYSCSLLDSMMLMSK
jgi:hypothetical protein